MTQLAELTQAPPLARTRRAGRADARRNPTAGLTPRLTIALLELRGTVLSQLCVERLRQDGFPAASDADRHMLTTLGLARRDLARWSLTPVALYRAELLARQTAEHYGIHHVVTGLKDAVVFGRCSCGFSAEAPIGEAGAARTIELALAAHAAAVRHG